MSRTPTPKTAGRGRAPRPRAGAHSTPPRRTPDERAPEPVRHHTPTPEQPTSFSEMGLPDPLLRALRTNGIAAPFPIQAAAIPDALAGRDVLGRGQTGSGKTLAFGLAMLARMEGGSAAPKRPRGLVLVPTRELALQVCEALSPYARTLGLWCRAVVGGLPFPRQADALQKGVDLLIATPGRLSDHLRQGTCSLADVACTTLDEADQMADMGFLPQVREILDQTAPHIQRLLFSATLDHDVDALVRRYLHDPVEHSVAPIMGSVSTIDHHLLVVGSAHRFDVVTEIAAREGRTILFARTKHHVDRLTRKLRSSGVRAGALHGGKTQGARARVLAAFRDGTDPVLVATDVAARGLHVDDVSLVVHIEPPGDEKAYLHRAGRTARAGESGTVVTIVTNEQRRTARKLTEKAGVRARTSDVTPGHAELIRITGARVPSGEPVTDPQPKQRAPRQTRQPRRNHRRHVGA